MSGFSGWEQFASLVHLHPLLPTTTGLLPGRETVDASDFVPLAHAEGGLVALKDRPFSAGSVYAPLPVLVDRIIDMLV